MLPQLGIFRYLIEAFLIIGLGILMLFIMTGFFHLIFKLMGAKGTILNAWKSMCYGIGPCIIGGFLPYISLFVAFYSLILQLYIGPKILFEVKESRLTIFLAIILALTFIEMFLKGTTAGFT
ncbi:MAG: YIP1 family protein [Promethearchaeota archaeon]